MYCDGVRRLAGLTFALALTGCTSSGFSQSENGADTNCAWPLLGRYRVYVEVGGERSATTEVTYFNSSCPGVATCAAARSYCAP